MGFLGRFVACCYGFFAWLRFGQSLFGSFGVRLVVFCVALSLGSRSLVGVAGFASFSFLVFGLLVCFVVALRCFFFFSLVWFGLCSLCLSCVIFVLVFFCSCVSLLFLCFLCFGFGGLGLVVFFCSRLLSFWSWPCFGVVSRRGVGLLFSSLCFAFFFCLFCFAFVLVVFLVSLFGSLCCCYFPLSVFPAAWWFGLLLGGGSCFGRWGFFRFFRVPLSSVLLGVLVLRRAPSLFR